jgi:hypothetical protein
VGISFSFYDWCGVPLLAGRPKPKISGVQEDSIPLLSPRNVEPFVNKGHALDHESVVTGVEI